MTKEDMKYIFVEVVNGRGNHGSFLRSFADAMVRADGANFAILHSAAEELVKKYKLDEYLDQEGV